LSKRVVVKEESEWLILRWRMKRKRRGKEK
jgi:hypothetical protein